MLISERKKPKEYFIKTIITSKYFAHKYCSLIYKGRLCEYHEYRKHKMYMLKKEEKYFKHYKTIHFIDSDIQRIYIENNS